MSSSRAWRVGLHLQNCPHGLRGSRPLVLGSYPTVNRQGLPVDSESMNQSKGIPACWQAWQGLCYSDHIMAERLRPEVLAWLAADLKI